MQATRVSILPETWTRNRLSGKSKVELRKQRIKEFIEARPYGSQIKLAELGRVAGYSSKDLSNISAMVRKMIEAGELVREPLSDRPGTRRFTYVVPKPVQVIEPAMQPEAEVPPVSEQRSQFEETPPDIIRLAKDFFWESKSDSLREFIEWLS